MGIVLCGVVPHPPVIVPEVGGKRADRTAASRDALLELGRRIASSGAETLVMITPHGAVFGDAVSLLSTSRLRGDLGLFDAAQVRFDLPNDLELAGEICKRSEGHGLPLVKVDEQSAKTFGRRDITVLDHGVTAPLYWLRRAGVELPLVVAGMGFLPLRLLHLFGRSVREAAETLNRKVALVASGDLSHRLAPDAPAGYSPRGRDFDARVVDLLRSGDVRGLIEIDEDLAEEAGECGLRPIIMMLGALEGLEFDAQVLSYEAPFGVGYMVAALKPGKARAVGRAGGEEAPEPQEGTGPVRRAGESFLVRLARRQVESLHRHAPQTVDPEAVPPEFRQPGGVFVSIKKRGRLRGCIGTIEPAHGTVYEEVLQNALAAAYRDPRFPPVRRDELDELDYSVDVLSPLEPVEDLSTLDPRKYGVVVSRGNRSGVLLPDLEGIDTVEEQLAVCRQKAGLSPEEPVSVYRFTVARYT